MMLDRTKMPEALRRVVQRMHYPLEVMLVCVRWYAPYPLSFRNIEERMAERGVFVDHSTLHRWSIKMLPGAFRRHKRPVGLSWGMAETYVKVSGQWKYLYRAVDRPAILSTSCCAPSEITPQPGHSSNAPWTCTTTWVAGRAFTSRFRRWSVRGW